MRRVALAELRACGPDEQGPSGSESGRDSSRRCRTDCSMPRRFPQGEVPANQRAAWDRLAVCRVLLTMLCPFTLCNPSNGSELRNRCEPLQRLHKVPAVCGSLDAEEGAVAGWIPLDFAVGGEFNELCFNCSYIRVFQRWGHDRSYFCWAEWPLRTLEDICD